MITENQLDIIQERLLSFGGEKYVSLATTANINNPPLHVGGMWCADNLMVANFVFSTTTYLEDIIKRFDSKIAAFLLDVEVKNNLKNLEEIAVPLIKSSSIIRFKPNDTTIFSLDVLTSLLFEDFHGKAVQIVGAGNLGSKISLILAERGANVHLNDFDQTRLQKISEVFHDISRGNGSFSYGPPGEILGNVDLILGCTPGVAAISLDMVKALKVGAVIIDAGNGTVHENAIIEANERGVRLFCLSPEPGFLALLKAIDLTQKRVFHMRRVEHDSGVGLIGPGVFGKYGDVIVDNPSNWKRIIGVCDGRGDVLEQKEAQKYIDLLK